MSWSRGLGWAAFAFMALAIAAGGYAKTDFHSAQAVLAASVAVFTGLAGLCLHPPWGVAAPSTSSGAPEPGADRSVQAGGRP